MELACDDGLADLPESRLGAYARTPRSDVTQTLMVICLTVRTPGSG